MLFLLDTNAFSDLMRNDSRVDARHSGLPETDTVTICPIVRGEILFGIQRLAQGKRRSELEAQAAALFDLITCEAVPEAAGDHYAAVRMARQSKGLSLDANDLWIAATALALGAVLVTRDSDYRQIDGLVVEDWSVEPTE